MKLYIGNLNVRTTEKQLTNLFAPFGKIISVQIVVNSYSKISRGFGFIEMADRASGEESIIKLNNFLLDEKHITVNESANSFRLYPKSES